MKILTSGCLFKMQEGRNDQPMILRNLTIGKLVIPDDFGENQKLLPVWGIDIGSMYNI